MPVTKSDIPQQLLPGLKGVFFEAWDLARRETIYEQIATIVPSQLDTENYGWIGAIPRIREFIGERQAREMKGYSYAIQNKTWEATIAVERSALEDDTLGHLKIRTQSLAREAMRHHDELVLERLINAYTSITGPPTSCYDGQNLVSSSHPVGSGTQSNYGGTEPLSASTLQSGIIAMQSFTDEFGRPFGLRPDVLLVGPALEWRARELLQSAIVVSKVGEGTAGGGATAATPYANVLQGAMRLIVTPYLTGAAAYYYYLISTTAPVRPIIFQDRVPVEFTALEQNSDAGFMRDEWLYGIRARYAAGGGLWQAVYMYAATT